MYKLILLLLSLRKAWIPTTQRLRAKWFPRKEGEPAPEFQELIALAMNAENPRPMVIQWDEGGYAIDVTMTRPDMIQGNAIVILGVSKTYPIRSNESYRLCDNLEPNPAWMTSPPETT